MPEDKTKDKDTQADKKTSGEKVDSIVGSLNVEESSEQREAVNVDAPTEQQPESKKQEDNKMELLSEPTHKKKLKTKLSELLGTLLLLFSLVIFGIPMIIGNFKRQFSAAVCLLLSLIIVLCSVNIGSSYLQAKAIAEQNGLTTPAPPGIAAITKPLLPDSVAALQPIFQTVVFPEGMLEKYKLAYSINPEVAGWLRIPNTAIDTILMQDKNNKYYLRNNFYGQYTEFGNAFIDYRNKLNSLNQNTIVYGHATQFTKLQAFYDLYKYMDYDFYTRNPIIEFGTLYKDYKWKVFAVYITSVQRKDDNGYFFNYIHPDINDSRFPGYLDQIKQRSRFFTDIGVNESDKILTLSTCVYDDKVAGKSLDARLVVAAKLMSEDESNEIDLSKVTDNPNYRRPQVWYNHRGMKNPYSNSEKWEL